MERTFVVAVVSLAVAGLVACATPPLPEIPPTHPASPLAAEAALAPVSDSLAIEPESRSETDGDRESAPAPSTDHGMHHGH